MSETTPPPSSTRQGTEKRQRTRHIDVRCSDEEFAAITVAAERAGLSVGAFMRRQALGTPGPRSARRPVPQKVELAQTLGLLGRVGGNVNQLARAFNTDGTPPTMAEWEPVQADIAAMRDALMRALGVTP